MNAILTLKPVTDKKGNIWHAGQIIGLSDAQAKTFVAAKNGLDLEGTNFATAALPDNTAAPVNAPSTADFSLAALGVNPNATVTPPATITYTIAATATDLDVSVAATPKNAGSYDFGDGGAAVTASKLGVASYTYAADGDYTITFTPADGNADATTSVTVAAAPVEPPPVDPITADATPTV